MLTTAEIESNIERYSALVDRAKEMLDDAETELAYWMAKNPEGDE